MSQIVEDKKKEYAAIAEKNRKIVFICKIVIYILVALLFVDMGTYFIFGAMMDKHNFMFDNVSIPLALVFFGGVALAIAIGNPRISSTSNTKGDKMMLAIGAIIILAGIGLLIYNLAM